MSNMAAYTTVPTYDKLIEVIQVYLNRYDQDTLDAIPFFINAAEKTMLRELRMPAMEKMVSFSLEENGNIEEGFVNLPFDYLEMKHMWITGPCSTTLQRVTFDQLIDEDKTMEFRNMDIPGYDVTRPKWAITADRLYVRGVDPKQDVYLTYYADVPEVSSDKQSNILLELVPDAFAYFAIAEGFRFLMEEAKSDYWENQAWKRLQMIKLQVEEAEFSGSPLTISPAGY